MLLIYTHTSSARLLYICSFIFKEQLGLHFSLTIDSEKFKAHTGPKLNYSDLECNDDAFQIKNHGLLFEKNIQTQTIECFTVNNYKAFFKTENSEFPFDIFAASFYLITRYEEYLPHQQDKYDRYAHENSLAYREGFLNLPLINSWINAFADKLKQKFSTLLLKFPTFNFLPTYDIDIAFSYRHKGLIRNLGGFLKSPSAERIKVLAGLAKDPFDCYDWLKALHEKNQLHPVYFFLVAEKNSLYDKNIPPQNDILWKLVRKHANKFTVGLHPSWQSGDKPALLKSEKQLLQDMSEKEITRSRQHYIRFNLPEGYQRLCAAGITDDYSMGYGSINGFRASVASSFYWYNLQADENTILRIHPFCFMDANSFYEQQQNVQQALDEMLHYLSVCKAVNGTLISIMHNNFLGTSNEFEGWRSIYELFIAQAQQ